jgi:hypothetical protein
MTRELGPYFIAVLPCWQVSWWVTRQLDWNTAGLGRISSAE